MLDTSKNLSLFGLIALSAILAACGAAAQPTSTPIPADGGGPMTAPTQAGPATQPPASGDLAGTSWTLTRIDSTAVDASIGATLKFNADGMVGGSGGCNSFGGSYTASGSNITFSQIASTLMACDDAKMAVETSYLGSLQGTGTFTLAAGTLTITNAKGVKLSFTASK